MLLKCERRLGESRVDNVQVEVVKMANTPSCDEVDGIKLFLVKISSRLTISAHVVKILLCNYRFLKVFLLLLATHDYVESGRHLDATVWW